MKVHRRDSGLGVFLGAAGLAGAISAVAADVVALVVQPGYSALRNSVSQLVLGPSGWIEQVGIYAPSVLLLALAFGLYLGVTRKSGVRIGILLLVGITVGGVVIGTFPTDIPGQGSTTAGTIHGIAAKAIALEFPFACFFILPSLSADRRWKNLGVYNLCTGVLGLVLVAVGMLAPQGWAYFGLYERILLGNGLLWIAVMALRVVKVYASVLTERRRALRAQPVLASTDPG